MKKESNLSKKKIILISIISIVIVALICVALFVFILPKLNTSNSLEKFVITNEDGKTTGSELGNYVYNDKVVDNINEYELASKERNLMNAVKNSTVKITTESNKKIGNVKTMQLFYYNDKKEMVELALTKENTGVSFTVPEADAIYYFIFKIEYDNGNKANYVFELNILSSKVGTTTLNVIIDKYFDKSITDKEALTTAIVDIERIKEEHLNYTEVYHEVFASEGIIELNYYIEKGVNLLDTMKMDEWAKQSAVPILQLFKECNKVELNVIVNDDVGDVLFIRNTSRDDLTKQRPEYTRQDWIRQVFAY